MVILIN